MASICTVLSICFIVLNGGQAYDIGIRRYDRGRRLWKLTTVLIRFKATLQICDTLDLFQFSDL